MSFDAMYAGGMAESRCARLDRSFFTQRVSLTEGSVGAAGFGEAIYLPVPQGDSDPGLAAPAARLFGCPGFQLWVVAMCVTVLMSATIALHWSSGLFMWSKSCKRLANHRVRLIPNATCGFSA